MRKVGEELDADWLRRKLAVCSWFSRGYERVASFSSHCQALLPFAVRPRQSLRPDSHRAGSLAYETTRPVASFGPGFLLTKAGGGERLVARG